MFGPPRKPDWQAAWLAQPFWNNGDPNEHFPLDTGRLRHVVELAADKAGWGRSLPAGEGLGIAAHRSFVSYVATVVHVKVDEEGRVQVPEAHVPVDCGFVANPEPVQSQIQGAFVFGMTAPLYSCITLENGAVVERTFPDYALFRAVSFPQ